MAGDAACCLKFCVFFVFFTKIHLSIEEIMVAAPSPGRRATNIADVFFSDCVNLFFLFM
jgi:hypothetical protein